MACYPTPLPRLSGTDFALLCMFCGGEKNSWRTQVCYREGGWFYCGKVTTQPYKILYSLLKYNGLVERKISRIYL